MMGYSSKKKGSFTTEFILDLEVEFDYEEKYGEIENLRAQIKLEDVDLYDQLPLKALIKIESEIMENIAYEKNHP